MENEITFELAAIIAVTIAAIIVGVLFLCMKDVEKTIDQVENRDQSELCPTVRYRMTAEMLDKISKSKRS